MKARLLFAEHDYLDASSDSAATAGSETDGLAADLISDLELSQLWDAMANGDDFLRRVVEQVTLQSLTSVSDIRYRQQTLTDCLANSDVVREIYALSVEAIVKEREIFRSFFVERGESLMRRSAEVLHLFVDFLRRFRRIAEEHAASFTSEAFTRLFRQAQHELSESYLAEIEQHASHFKSAYGIVLSAQLGPGNRGISYVLRQPRPENRSGFLRRRLLKQPTSSFTIPERDDAGFRAAGEIRDRAVDTVAQALSAAAEHVLDFFVALRTELAFYLGGLHLHDRLTSIGDPVCFPNPEPANALVCSAHELYDPCLALRLNAAVTANDVEAGGKSLIVVTGANQGGKSTFLRSYGVAQLQMQAGLFVAARVFSAPVASRIFTHYRREEDDSMKGVKFDEELTRMSRIVDRLQPRSLLLFNESFAATNEREGTDIAYDIIWACLDSDVRVVFVTHMYDLARRFVAPGTDALLLRADRQADGTRDFRLRVAQPLETSFGADLFKATFGNWPRQTGAESAHHSPAR